MEASICKLCGKKSALRTKRTYTNAEILYTLYECGACHAHFWTPMINPGSEWYERDVRYADRNQYPILTANEKHTGTLNFLGNGNGRRVLDVGCGVGNFLAEAKKRGWEAHGIDFDKDAILAAQKVFDLHNLEVGDVVHHAHTHPKGKYDLITFFDVFEHIDNHEEFVNAIKNLLNPQGFISVSVPYRNAWRWLIPHDLPPRHLTRWDDKALASYFDQRGFKCMHAVRIPASIRFIILKLRFQYGGVFTFNAVRTVSKLTSGRDRGTVTEKRVPLVVRAAHAGARIKDLVFFGLPAVCIWFALLFTRKRYTDMYLVLQKI